MSAQELITEHLDLWTGAITKKSTSGRGSSSKIELTGINKLRELILELAVRGKLVEQDPSEEPAHLILERLDSTVKKSRGKPRASCGASEPSLPTGWASFRVGDYLDFQYGKSLPAKQRDDSGSIEVYGSNGVVGFHTMALTEEPCIVVGRKGSAGALNKALGPSWTTDVAYYVQPRQGFDFEFTYLLLQSLHLDQLGKGIKPGVNRNEAYALSASLPPLEEQRRIVQKVDELMAFCDRLEQQTSDQLEAHETLVDTLLSTLTQSENAAELAENWARLAAHFDTLFTTEQSVDKLKQTILQLAVMGRLVEQDAGDEPALTLLQSIEDRKTDLVKTGAIKRSKTLPPVSDEERPFKLPIGWECYRLGELVSKLGSGSTPRGGQQAYVETGVPFLRSQNVWNDGLKLDDIVYILEETHARMGNTIVYPKDILLNITGASLGRSTIFPDHIPEANVSQHVTIIRLIEPEMTPFVHLCIQSPLIQRLVWGRQVGMAIEGLSKKVLERFEMPIPPLAEQHRIVQKIDELMTLCDQLKERLNQASETRCQLAEAVVEQGLSA